jgi:hypothetical protein
VRKMKMKKILVYKFNDDIRIMTYDDPENYDASLGIVRDNAGNTYDNYEYITTIDCERGCWINELCSLFNKIAKEVFNSSVVMVRDIANYVRFQRNADNFIFENEQYFVPSQLFKDFVRTFFNDCKVNYKDLTGKFIEFEIGV